MPEARKPEAKKPVQLKISSREQAVKLCQMIANEMNGLIELLQSEAELVRQARYRGAAALTSQKSEATARFSRALEIIKANRRALDRYAPAEVQELQRLNSVLAAAAQENLPVLKTAREVSARIVSGVAAVAKQKASGPSVYGSNGSTSTPHHRNAATLAVNRAL